MKNTVYLLLGSNLDDRQAVMKNAREMVNSTIGAVTQESAIYESEPWGFYSEHRFLNQVIIVETIKSPVDILEDIREIETRLGRKRTQVEGYTSRNIDIDILFFNDEIIIDKKLIIPHPKIPERMFTLIPLSELNSSMIHPGSKKTVEEMISECQDRLLVYPYYPQN
jgi:2-amino-4-hydroxy-6-hydroxymethyldihydropteridine diphosphokinase